MPKLGSDKAELKRFFEEDYNNIYAAARGKPPSATVLQNIKLMMDKSPPTSHLDIANHLTGLGLVEEANSLIRDAANKATNEANKAAYLGFLAVRQCNDATYTMEKIEQKATSPSLQVGQGGDIVAEYKAAQESVKSANFTVKEFYKVPNAQESYNKAMKSYDKLSQKEPAMGGHKGGHKKDIFDAFTAMSKTFETLKSKINPVFQSIKEQLLKIKESSNYKDPKPPTPSP